jgi:small subunit ribosomal protein S3
MGQKINPILYRIVAKKNWKSSFFLPIPYSNSFILDIKIRNYLNNLFQNLNISNDIIIIKKYPLLRTIYITTTISYKIRPTDLPLKVIENHLKLLTGYHLINLDFSDISERQLVKMIPLQNAELLSKYIANLIESRSKSGIKKILIALKEVSNLKGYKITISGRINGVEIARHKTYKSGSLPLQSINCAIDYAYNIAYTKYGIIGVKVWLHFIN